MQVGKKHEHDMGDSEAHSKRIDYGIGNLVDYQADPHMWMMSETE